MEGWKCISRILEESQSIRIWYTNISEWRCLYWSMGQWVVSWQRGVQRHQGSSLQWRMDSWQVEWSRSRDIGIRS